MPFGQKSFGTKALAGLLKGESAPRCARANGTFAIEVLPRYNETQCFAACRLPACCSTARAGSPYPVRRSRPPAHRPDKVLRRAAVPDAAGVKPPFFHSRRGNERFSGGLSLAQQPKHEKPANGIKNRRGAAVRAASRHGAACPQSISLGMLRPAGRARGPPANFPRTFLTEHTGGAGGAFSAIHRTGGPFYRQEGRPMGGLPASNFAGVCRPQSGAYERCFIHTKPFLSRND